MIIKNNVILLLNFKKFKKLQTFKKNKLKKISNSLKTKLVLKIHKITQSNYQIIKLFNLHQKSKFKQKIIIKKSIIIIIKK